MAKLTRTYSIRTLLVVTVVAAIFTLWFSKERPKEREISFGTLRVTRQFGNNVYKLDFHAFGCIVSTASELRALENKLKPNLQLLQVMAEKAVSRLDEQKLKRNQLGLLQRELLTEARKSLGLDESLLKSVGLISYDCVQVNK